MRFEAALRDCDDIADVARKDDVLERAIWRRTSAIREHVAADWHPEAVRERAKEGECVNDLLDHPTPARALIRAKTRGGCTTIATSTQIRTL
jgi:hypothetical protein